ncbi:MAG: amino acid ABC transporter permease [Treponema sp.]|jgi:L-cystine transport system permease protein|nr:amino acid ABC transporter permease [Treponema sp.]
MKDFFSFERFAGNLPLIFQKIPVTLSIVLASMSAGLLLGICAALIRLYRTPALYQIISAGVSFLRCTPVIAQLFVVYFGVPYLLSKAGINAQRWHKFIFVNVTYALNAGAFISEIIRASILSVDPGQREAALSCGLTDFQAFRRIVAPQAALVAAPGFSANVLALLQNTSLGFTIGAVEIVGQVRLIAVRTHHAIEGYAAAALIFVVLSFIISFLFSLLEKNIKQKINGGAAPGQR